MIASEANRWQLIERQVVKQEVGERERWERGRDREIEKKRETERHKAKQTAPN